MGSGDENTLDLERARAGLKRADKAEHDFRVALDEYAIVSITDPAGSITFVNKKFCAITQYDEGELLGKDPRLLNSQTHSKEFFADLWKTIQAGNVWRGEIRNQRKDGTLYWVNTTIVPFLSEEGTPEQYLAICADITEEKLDEARLDALTEELDRRGHELEAVIHETARDLKSPLVDEAGLAAPSDEQRDVDPECDKEGSNGIAISRVAKVVERVLGTLSLQQKLDQVQSQLIHVSEATGDVFWMLDAAGDRTIHVSPAFEKLWGEPVSKLYEDSSGWIESIVEEDRSRLIKVFERFRGGYQSQFDEVYRIRTKLGEIRWIRDHGHASRDGNGEVVCLSGVATDISERKDLERQVVEAAEHERIRIGQDLHDDLCQRLAALKLECANVVDALRDKDAEQAKVLQGIVKEMAEATKLSRSIAKGLSPVSLEAEGLMISLEELANMIEGRFQVPCRFDCPVPVEVNSQTCATHVFRIAQELLNNAARHAHPSRILIGLYQAPGGFKLEIVNDGVPFHGPVKKTRGMGLHFVKFRADAIGASLEFFPGSMPDGGTRVVCFVPTVATTDVV